MEKKREQGKAHKEVPWVHGRGRSQACKKSSLFDSSPLPPPPNEPGQPPAEETATRDQSPYTTTVDKSDKDDIERRCKKTLGSVEYTIAKVRQTGMHLGINLMGYLDI